jgi:hypothetical protein
MRLRLSEWPQRRRVVVFCWIVLLVLLIGTIERWFFGF